MKTVFVYSDALAGFDYGASHPLKPVRLKLAFELIKACGLLSADDARLVEPLPANDQDLLEFHSEDYIQVLREANRGRSLPGARFFGLGPGDNPVFPGVLDWSRLVAGASLLAAELVASGRADTAFNIGGGLHHARAAQASGFCYINDVVLAIRSLLKRGMRVAYIDIDAHHGDGVQEAFYTTDRVLTISLHETGNALFPGTGFAEETGEGEGKGYCANVPLPPGAGDELFLSAFNDTVPELVDAYRPDVVVSQLGVDAFRSDPLSDLSYTTNAFCQAVGTIRLLAPKWLALGGGGYDLANVARAWTLAWAIMNDAEAPRDVPQAFFEAHRGEGFGKRLRDEAVSSDGPPFEQMKREVRRAVEVVRERVLERIVRREHVHP
jgi:acetoin utilization protein AcuC